MAKMDKSVQKTLVIMVGIVAIGLLSFLIYTSLSPINTVTGDGMATIKAVPDLISVYFNVDTTGNTSKVATDKNSEIVDKLITELIKQGFERSQVQTTGFNVYPDYDYSKQNPVLKGYRATHSITVKMSSDDSDKIGDVVDAGVSAGAGVSYINFELSQEKQNEYKAQALKTAAEDARTKAQSIAEGLGKRLGRLVSTSESSFNYYPWNIYESRGGVATMDSSEVKAATTNIVPGEQDITANVRATFKIR